MKVGSEEGIERQIPLHLRDQGHTVVYVAETEPGLSDSKVLSLCREESALLATSDKDFRELVYRRGEVHEGVVLLRLAGLPAEKKAAITVAFITEHAEHLQESFPVLEPGRARIRSGPLR